VFQIRAVEKNETHIDSQYSFSLILSVFEMIKQKRFYSISSYNWRTVGLVLMKFNIGDPFSSSPPILRYL
jgi:hypothetical protein